MNSIGAQLKEARNKKSITLEDVHSKIKIHPRVLQLLEEDKFEKLPSPLFAKNFLKSYAEFLEVNSEELMRAYDQEPRKEPEQILFLKSADENIRSSKTDSNSFFILLLVAAVLFAAGGFFYLFKTGHLLPKKKIAVHEAREAVKPPKHEKILKKVQEKPVPAKEEIKKVSADMLNSAELGNFPAIDRKTPLQIQMRALEPVWVHVTCDGKVLFQGILKKGTAESWSAKDSIEIWTGNATNMAMTLNQVSLGSPGKGLSKKMIITHDGIKNLTQGKLT